MSWEVASFLIVGAVILAGFAWYERSRPPAQVVALVAALAALAIVGRIAFAAFPNVKPTTDIVIFAGYALGGAPGFAVGALAALVSNFWFGQGPWTPWQMAGWGLCGVLGAFFGRGTRNPGRLTLAAICGFAGIFYGALLNFSLMATYGGDFSLRHFLVLEARAIPFEVAHVVGNVVLALVAGPAMVRMLVRFRERFEWQRRSGGQDPAQSQGSLGSPLGSGGIAAMLLLVACAALAPAPAQASEVSHATEWLEAQQRPSGGFPSAPDRDAGAEMTSWSMLALAASGRNPLDVTKGGKSPVDFLRNHMDEVSDAGDVARTILALAAAGVDPRGFAGEDLVDRLISQRRGNGSYQGWPGTSAYAVLALRAAGANQAAAPTVAWLRKVQGREGGWGNEPQSPATAEVTGAVLQVLTPGSDAADRALDYLRRAKRPNGGFAPGKNLSANAQATAWASQGLLAAGKDPAGFGPGRSSFTYMRELQAGDGFFFQAPGMEVSPVWVTADVVVALSGKHLPVAAPPREPKPKPTSTASPTSSGGVAPSPSLSGAPPALPESSGGGTSALEEAFESSAGSSSPGSGAGRSAGGRSPGILPSIPSTGGDTLEEDFGTAPEASDLQYGEQASEPAEEEAGAGGAIILGLLTGALLFALGLAARRGWMRWRYGL